MSKVVFFFFKKKIYTTYKSCYDLYFRIIYKGDCEDNLYISILLIRLLINSILSFVTTTWVWYTFLYTSMIYIIDMKHHNLTVKIYLNKHSRLLAHRNYLSRVGYMTKWTCMSVI